MQDDRVTASLSTGLLAIFSEAAGEKSKYVEVSLLLPPSLPHSVSLSRSLTLFLSQGNPFTLPQSIDLKTTTERRRGTEMRRREREGVRRVEVEPRRHSRGCQV